MMTELEVGLKGEKEMVVQSEDLASFGGNIGAEVLSTPRVILLMEQTAREAIEGALPEGKITVGTLINMKHFAATPLGCKVRAQATLIDIDGRRLVFDVVAYDDFEKISEGVNERIIVSINKFLQKVKKKQAKG
jgi:predicted thioesterase